MNLKLHILHFLDEVDGLGLSATTLSSQLQLILHSRPGDQALYAALTDLLHKALITTEKDGLTGDPVYKLTPAGTTMVRQ